MGDRVIFVFKSGDYVSSGVYAHWYGHRAASLLAQAGEAGIIRQCDAGYSAARLCGFLHEQAPRSTTGLGIWPPPANLTDDCLREYSHGDAGIILVDVGERVWGTDPITEGAITYSHGYLGREDYEGDPLPSHVKLSE